MDVIKGTFANWVIGIDFERGEVNVLFQINYYIIFMKIIKFKSIS